VEFAAPFAHASSRVYRSNRRALQIWCLLSEDWWLSAQEQTALD
jgi:hypothetical protein